MAVNFPPYYTSQILNADGKPVAGGTIRAYFTGTESPAPLFASDGTPLGSSVSIDAAGNAVFCLRVGTTYRLRCIDADGAVVWTRDGVRALGETAGIENPMNDYADLIVGGAGGDPVRLGRGNPGQMLTPSTFGQPHLEWVDIPVQTGDHKVMADTMDQAPGALTQKLKAGTNITIGLDTSGGTRKVEISAATQEGDHKTAVDGTDSAPGYLLDKLVDGDNAHFSKSGNTVVLDTDNDAVATDNQDESPGFLIDKLEAGDNVAIEAVEVNGVRKAKISATGGGGGGGDQVWQSTWPWGNGGFSTRRPYSIMVQGVSLPSTIKSFTVFPNFNPYSLIVYKFVLWVAVYDLSVSGSPLISSFTWSDAKHPSTDWSNTFATFNFDAPFSIDRTHNYRAVFYWYDSYASNRNWLGCYQQGGNSYICGHLDLYYSATGLPPSSYNNSGWTTQPRIPWFQLNSFSV